MFGLGKFHALVGCNTCRLLLRRIDAQKVKSEIDLFGNKEEGILYFCPSHTVKYEKRRINARGVFYLREMYVSEDGIPHGYKEISKEQDSIKFPPLQVQNDLHKQCKKCLKSKPLTEFHTHSQSKDKKRSHCKKCVSKYMKEWSLRKQIKNLA